MSNVSKIHDVVKYESGKSKAFAGQRLAKFSWKTPKEGALKGIKPESKCLSIPPIAGQEITENLAALIPHIAEYLHSVQDSIIRNKLESNADCTAIAESEFNLASVIGFLNAGESSESARLTKETVKAWFDAEVSEMLAIKLAEKLGVSEVPTDAESNKILAVVNAFGDKISMLSSGKTKFPKEIAISVKNAIELAECADAGNERIKVMFTKRLDAMIAVPEGDDLLALL